MTKILRPYTIIPDHLYVMRDADRQIKSIIEDMGRPGYVLVSRQMGKTNMLLNAKRNLPGPSDIFVYIDLSNPFESARSCFENIIECAVETDETALSEAYAVIKSRRLEMRDVPAHKQHTNELRILLNSYSGKLVIILDEIDALTKTSYSDQIFAQIRSMYFSRVNFQELERLTYILSGVVEPTEIIKDPKISPFNIGQKIFLNDFSKLEFESLLEKSDLRVSNQVKERIFHWTSGNPRITWDVCAEVENHLSKEKDISVEELDKIINDMYLVSYDKPPIDNIRELVENDREIRNAIVEIHYKKGSLVSDKIKSKLYLAGITNYQDSSVEIKNEIIKESLNIAWIKSLESNVRTLFIQAFEHYDNQNFSEALDLFEQYLENNEFDEQTKSISFYYMGYAAYRQAQFGKAITYLKKTAFDLEDNRTMYHTALNLIAIAEFLSDNIEESLQSLQIIIDSGRTDEIYVRALLNYCSFSLKADNGIQVENATKLYEDIIAGRQFPAERLSEKFVKEIRSIAYYNLAQIFQKSGELVKAKESYYNAINNSTLKSRAKFIADLLDIIEDEATKEKLLEELVNHLADGTTLITAYDPENSIAFSIDDFQKLVTTLFMSHDYLFNRLISKINDMGNLPLAQHLYEMGVSLYDRENNVIKPVQFFTKLFELINRDLRFRIGDDVRFEILKVIAYSTDINENSVYHLEYLKILHIARNTPIDAIDLEIFVSIIQFFNRNDRSSDALFYAQMINGLKSNIPKAAWINFLPIYHMELVIYSQRNDKANMVRRANEIINLSSDQTVISQKSNILRDQDVAFILSTANSVIKPAISIASQTLSTSSYSRNAIVKVKYLNGQTTEKKYKRVEKDIKDGKCVLVVEDNN